MTNVGTIGTIQQLAQYLPDGVHQVLEGLVRFLPPDVKVADDLSLYSAVALHTIVAISATPARPLVVIAQSNGTACTVKVYGDQAGDVTVGSSECVFSIGVSATAGQISAALVLGNGVKALCDAQEGLSIAAPTTDQGTADAANDPNVWVIYG